MQRPWVRTALGSLAGIVVALLCIFAIERLGHILYPPPDGIDFSNPEDVERMMATLPAMAFVFVLAGWFIGSLFGAWTANAIARRPLAGWIVTAVIVAGGVATMAMIPHPVWMWVAGIALPLAAGWLAQRFAPVPG